MDEFQLIDAIVAELGSRAAGEWVTTGPGDDGTVVAVAPDHEAVASIDALVAGVHFPAEAPGEPVGYRAMMVSLSDLAAMAAEPRYVLVAATLPEDGADWALDMARGMKRAADECGVYVCGGNLARGPKTVTISVHGEVPTGRALLRSGASAGEGIFVSGPLGAAAACVRTQEFTPDYYEPRARFDLVQEVRAGASAGIDISDGLLKDLGHVLSASGVGAEIESAQVPLGPRATLDDALRGGDDYELLCIGSDLPSFTRIGSVVSAPGLRLDGKEVEPDGYRHF